MVVDVSSIGPDDMSYSIIRNDDGRPIGLMFSANNIHNQANFTCIGFDVNQPGLTPLSTNAVNVEVAGIILCHHTNLCTIMMLILCMSNDSSGCTMVEGQGSIT